MEKLNDVSRFINRLGGTTPCSRLFGVSRAAVSRWKADNKIPWLYYIKARELAAKAAIEFDDTLFERKAPE